MTKVTGVMTAVALLLGGGAAAAQDAANGRAGALSYPGPNTFPKSDEARVTHHLSSARKIAGTDLFQAMAHRCIFSPVYTVRTRNVQFNGRITPTKLFDNLYSIGQNAVSAQALQTSDGLIIFDALNSEDEAKNLLVPNLVALGLDPQSIRYVVITHGHGDHYGGARYLQQTYGAKVVASAADWELMQRPSRNGPFANLVPPERDIVMADGGTLALGTTRVKFYVTPGHTPGVLSSIFAVKDRGQPHVVGYFGGTGGASNAGPSEARQHIKSLKRWETISKAAGVDVNITNHPLHNEGLEKEEMLRHRGASDSNPLVIGKSTYQRYLQVQEECTKVQLARLGEPE